MKMPAPAVQCRAGGGSPGISLESCSWVGTAQLGVAQVRRSRGRMSSKMLGMASNLRSHLCHRVGRRGQEGERSLGLHPVVLRGQGRADRRQRSTPCVDSTHVPAPTHSLVRSAIMLRSCASLGRSGMP